MASNTNTPLSSRVPVPVTVAIAVLAVLVIGFVGYRTFFYTPGLASGAQMEKQTTDQDFLKKKAKECGGVFAKLSPEDQKHVNEITSGQGEFAIRTMANRVANNP